MERVAGTFRDGRQNQWPPRQADFRTPVFQRHLDGRHVADHAVALDGDEFSLRQQARQLDPQQTLG